MTLAALCADAARVLSEAGVPDARLDAEYLLAYVLRCERLPMLLSLSRQALAGEITAYEALIARRAAREPLAYITGEQSFMGLAFEVTPDVLIPRADTETLCECALRDVRAGDHVLDLCTGSGALAVAIAANCPGACLYAGDLSPAALRVARRNALRHHVAVDFRCGDLFAPFEDDLFQVIVSNPPYICEDDLSDLQSEVLREPRLALNGGADGLVFYRRIAREAPVRLCPGGALMLETGDGQSEAVAALLAQSGAFDNIRVFDDMQRLPRVVTARRKG